MADLHLPPQASPETSLETSPQVSSQTPSQPAATPADATSPVTVRKCWLGAVLAGILALLLYRLTGAIATSFADHPPSLSNQLTYNIAVAVRTLVVGGATMGTGIFALTTLGLVGLGLQLWLRPATPPKTPR